ncbi:unnamed protein product [Trichogramma brassicae]|uniref:Uncharacterized protein n=1 Tax=Trichogramma brassicae TaxID=86971 RepID=A0A6H5IN37_9HYME|nr:unnamed protein product [Trichogramma brassicae]
MDHLNQDDLLKLKSLRKKVNWGIEKQRVELLRRVINLFNEWNGQLPNLLDVFRFYEIDWLISEVISNHMTDYGEDICRSEGLIDFVISTGYKNKPLVDEDGKPALNRTTPLHHAARNFDDSVKLRRVVGKLFKIYDRIDVNYIDESGRTHFHVACMSGHYDVVKGFLDFGQDPNQLLTETGESPLHLAIHYFSASECYNVVELLLRRGADPNKTDKFGWTPLYWICGGQNIDLAKMLFAICDEKHVPVQVNVRDKLDRTPLYIALIMHRNRTLIKILLRRGADPHFADKQGNTALHLICMDNGCNRLLKKFFKICDDMGHKIQVNARNNMNQTPLHLSLHYRNRHLVEFLLRRGADPNVVDNYGLTPLHMSLGSTTSVTQNEDDFVEVFFNINDEIQQTVQVDVQDHAGRTPLNYALRCKHLKTAEYLLRRGIGVYMWRLLADIYTVRQSSRATPLAAGEAAYIHRSVVQRTLGSRTRRSQSFCGLTTGSGLFLRSEEYFMATRLNHEIVAASSSLRVQSRRLHKRGRRCDVSQGRYKQLCSSSDSAPADGLAIPLPPPPPQLRQMRPAARPNEQQQATTASLASSSDEHSYNEPNKQKIGRRSSGGEAGIQLTPVWEYVARQREFPRDVEPRRLFHEISERLRDPEWQVRQHALRVLIDVLPCLAADDRHRTLDELVQELLLRDLVDNLGSSAPAVRKGSLDALRIYLLHSGERDLATKRILRMGVDRPAIDNDAEDGDRVLRGVLLSAPLLLFPSRSTGRPSSALVREATRTLAMHLVQVQHQEAALRSLVKIRDSCDDDGDENADGLSEVDAYLRQIDESIVRNFELLCDVYGLGKRKKRRSIEQQQQPAAKKKSKQQQLVKASDKVRSSADENRRKTAVSRRSYQPPSRNDVVVPLHVAKWESDDEDDDNKSDSDTSGIAEVDDESSDRRSGSGSSVTSARVVLETEIKFNEETAITMTILEEQDKEVEGAEISEESSELQRIEAGTDQSTKLLAVVDEKKKLPRQIVKLRTPDSEDASSVASSVELSASSGRRSSSRSPPPTRIPLPVAPATRLPVAQPRRSLSQPTRSSSRNKNQSRSFARRRSASSSPKRDVYVHDASLSPKKSILAKSSDFGDSRSSATGSRSRSSRRDSYVAASALAAVEAPAFQIYEEPDDVDVDVDDDDEDEDCERTPSPGFLGEACGIVDGDHEEANHRRPIESVFGDRSDYESYDKIWKNQENKLTRSMQQQRQRSNSALETPTRFDYWQDEETDSRRRSHSAIPGYEVFPRQERNYILMELSSPSKSRRASLASIASDSRSGKSEQTDEKQQQQQIDNKDDEDEEKIALDAKEKSSSDGSDVEWKSPIEESWEELGLVDDEILNDFHNKVGLYSKVRL